MLLLGLVVGLGAMDSGGRGFCRAALERPGSTGASLSLVVPKVSKAEPAAEWNERFRRTEGWVGADGAYSVPISDTKTLWLFSDTLVGSIADGRRKNITMVNNTIGIQNGTSVEFAIRKSDKPVAMLVPPKGTPGHFWIQAGIHANGKLNIFLPRIELTKGGGAFGFKHVDQWLATIDNPGAAPPDWKASYSKIPHEGMWGGAVCRDGDFVYVYGHREKPAKPFADRRLLTARVPADKIADFNEWRFLGDDKWTTTPDSARAQVEKIATEFSVSFVPGLKQFALVYTENGLGDRIMGRFAPSPAGPWSEAVLLYKCPEMKGDRKVFCYAAKAHPHLAANGRELVLTYCVNGFELGTVMNDPTLYWPNFVRVTFE